jgi:hypothetical protein
MVRPVKPSVARLDDGGGSAEVLVFAMERPLVGAVAAKATHANVSEKLLTTFFRGASRRILGDLFLGCFELTSTVSRFVE